MEVLALIGVIVGLNLLRFISIEKSIIFQRYLLIAFSITRVIPLSSFDDRKVVEEEIPVFVRA